MDTQANQRLNDVMQAFARQYVKQSEEMIKQQATITSTQAHILMLLFDSQQRLANKQLATAMSLTRPAITKAIKELIQANCLSIQRDKNDRRRIEYQLTPHGRMLAQQHQAGHQAQLVQLAEISAQYTPHELVKIEQFMQAITQQLSHGDDLVTKGK